MKPKTIALCCIMAILFFNICTAFSQTIYVDGSMPDNSGSGSSWSTAKKDIQNAIAIAVSGNEIWVKGGTYYPTQDITGNTTPTDPRDVVFYLKNGVKLYGGFDGTETLLSQRNWVINVTTLSGDIGTLNDSTDNSYHVVLSVADNNTTIFDGFTVTRGIANGSGTIFTENNGITRYLGGGMYSASSSPTVNNCIFTRNSCIETGGGFYNGLGAPKIYGCEFSYNYVRAGSGGGLYMASSATITINISNCKFLYNIASSSGGGVETGGGNYSFDSCIFTGNNTGSQGGGLRTSGANLTLSNCSFSGNGTRSGGGLSVFQFGGKTISVHHCKFSSNTADLNGGGIYLDNDPISISDCIFENNTANLSGGGIFNRTNSVIKNCVFVGNTSLGANGGGGFTNGFNYGKLVNCVFQNNQSSADGGAICAFFSKCDIINCTVFNNSATGTTSKGAGIYFTNNSGGNVYNSILWNNTTPLNTSDNNREEINSQNSSSTTKPTVAYSIVRDYTLSGTININSGSNVITSNPSFSNESNPDGADNMWMTADDGLQLKPGSPALDFGDNSAIPSDITTDIKGSNRVANATVDLGAYEGSYDCRTSSTSNLTICSNALPYSWDGLTFTAAGTQTKTGLTNAAGCDSSAVYNLTVNQSTSSDTTVAICNSFTWHDSTYKASGDYVWHTTNAAGCDSAVTLHLTILSVSSTFTKTDAACFNSATGSITITPTSGFGPYTYRIGTTGTYGNSNTFTGLRAGNYRVSILDVYGCAGISAQITITQPPAITATVIKTNAGCYGSYTGSIIVNPTSGLSPYTFKLGTSGTYGTSNTFSALRAGTYTVYILDANNCPGTLSVTIGQSPKVSGTATVTNVTCNAGSNGTVTINPTVGAAPYTYRLGSTGVFGTNNVFTGLRSGTYTVYVMDNNGCTGTISATITQPPVLTVTTTATNVNCFGGTNGTITLNAAGGATPYSYRLSPTAPYGTNNIFTGLSAGTYNLSIKDANSCVTSVVNNIMQPAKIAATSSVINESCPNAKNGSITIIASGGTPPYGYRFGSVGSYVPSNTFTGLKAGNYRIFVNDANNCSGYSILSTVGQTSPTCSISTRMGATQPIISEVQQGLTIQLSPNPTNRYFTLRVKATNQEAIQIRVIDVNGKSLFTAKGLPEQSIRFGELFAPGVYMIEVRQGNEVRMVKGVKIK